MGAAPASGGLTQPPTPGGARAASSATTSRPGPTTVEATKGKMPALARRKARGVTLHAQGPAIRARPGVTRSRAGLAKSRPCALWRAIPLDFEGDGREE